MTKPGDTPKPTMEDLLQTIAGDAFPSGALCTAWVLITEWMDSNGAIWTWTAADPNSPPWRKQGLVQWSLDAGLDDYDDDEEDDEDD